MRYGHKIYRKQNVNGLNNPIKSQRDVSDWIKKIDPTLCYYKTHYTSKIRHKGMKKIYKPQPEESRSGFTNIRQKRRKGIFYNDKCQPIRKI